MRDQYIMTQVLRGDVSYKVWYPNARYIMTSLLTRTSRARCHIRFECVTLALVVTLTHNPRWVVTYLLIGWRQYDVMWDFPKWGLPNVIKLLSILFSPKVYTHDITNHLTSMYYIDYNV